MKPESKSQLGETAVEMGLLGEPQLRDALGIQDQLRELGVAPKAIEEICIEKGYLTREQVAEVEARLRLKLELPQIPGYRILSKLGRGGMGVVYKARQESLDRNVAIKILSPRLAGDPTYIQRFLSEARAVARLNHKNVIAGIDVGEANGQHFFAMEFIDGETTSRRTDREGPLPETDVVSIGVQMGQALAHAAEHGLVHRDIKPQNIMLTGKGVAKLCDLGLAKQEEAPAQSSGESRSLGTPYYISPEQAKGPEFADTRSDIYSLGATLYHLATGEPPFGGPSALVIMTKQMTEAPPSARRKNPRISRELDRIILRMMAKKKEDRYPTPEALTEDLLKIGSRASQGAVGRKRRFVRRVSRGRQSQPGPIIAGVVILLIAVVSLIIVVTSSGEEGGGVSTWDPAANAALRTATAWVETHPGTAVEVRVRRLQQIVQEYPGTSAAERAREAITAIRAGR